MIVDKTGSELLGYFVAVVGERPWCAQNEIGALTQAIHVTYQKKKKNVHCSTTLLFPLFSDGGTEGEKNAPTEALALINQF